jgi:hypothetical protein
MHYEKNLPCPERKEAIFETIKQTLLPLNFQVIRENDTILELKSSGFLGTQGQSPFMGISDITIDIEGQNLKIRANLGVLKKVIWYLILFLLFTEIILVVLFIIIFGPSQKILLLCLASFSSGPILIPIMYFFMKSRTSRAVDIMVSNAVGRDV